MLQRVTDPSETTQDATIEFATRQVQVELDKLTVFDTHRVDLRKIMGAGLKALENSPPLTPEQMFAVMNYEQALPDIERACLRLYRYHRLRSQDIAAKLNVDVEWVRRTNARHLVGLRARLYCAE